MGCHYPEKVLADPIYGTHDTRRFLNEKGIRFAGKPLGRPPKMSSAEDNINRRQRQQDYRERIPIEGKFGQGKNGYNLNYIRARTSKTSESWIRSIFLVMNLLVPFRLLFARILRHIVRHVTAVLHVQLHRFHKITARQIDKLKQSPLLEMTF
ncbi:MAG: transposase [Hyphomicrobiales bacterium]|nr:transposase [Hyphomicrobiales bacterium]